MEHIARTSQPLGAIIRRARKAAGISQAALAEKVGIWQETVSKIENGQGSTKIDTILDILAALQLEIEVKQRGKVSTSLEDIF